jgi:hypothetical protein
MAEGRLLVPATSATFDFEGKRIWLQQGRTPIVREGHPITRGREHLFKPLVVDFETEVPQETPKAPAPKAPAPKAQQAVQPKPGAKSA